MCRRYAVDEVVNATRYVESDQSGPLAGSDSSSSVGIETARALAAAGAEVTLAV
jgi:hypothetical protein